MTDPTEVALQLDEIVSEISKYISSSQLLSLRSVSRQWDGLIKSRIRRRRDLVIRLEARTLPPRPVVGFRFRPGDILGPQSESESQQVEARNLKFLEYLHDVETDENLTLFIPSVLKLDFALNTLSLRRNDECFESIYTICEFLGSRELVINWKRPPELRGNMPDGSPVRLLRILGSLKCLHTLDIQTFPEHQPQLPQGHGSQVVPCGLELSSLQVLKLPGKTSKDNLTRSFIPLKSILISSPNLMRIVAVNYCHCQDIINHLVERSSLLRIRSLSLKHIDENMMDKILSSVSHREDFNLPLEHLHFGTQPQHRQSEETEIPLFKLVELLRSLKSTVRNLSLSLEPFLRIIETSNLHLLQLDQLFPPTFPSLRKLSLGFPPDPYNRSRALFRALASFNFPLVTPSLETFELRSPNVHGGHGNIHTLFKCLTVKELILDLGLSCREDGDGIFTWFQSLFPNVGKLSLNNATNSLLKQLWSTHDCHWTLLELEISFNKAYRKDRDHMLFGLSEELVRECADQDRINLPRGAQGALGWLGGLDMYSIRHIANVLRSSSPGTLGNLRNIRTLRIMDGTGEEESQDLEHVQDPRVLAIERYALLFERRLNPPEPDVHVQPKSFLISNLSVYFGFGEMKQLRTLQIGTNAIDASGIRFLRENLPELVHLSI